LIEIIKKKCAPGSLARSKKLPARGSLTFSKKRARSHLKAWMRACAFNVLYAARPGTCKHAAEWAAADTLSGSLATITRPGAHDAFLQIVFEARQRTPDKLC